MKREKLRKAGATLPVAETFEPCGSVSGRRSSLALHLEYQLSGKQTLKSSRPEAENDPQPTPNYRMKVTVSLTLFNNGA